jgi:3-methyladenine DNA glycosylase/8-oxoguanine DNA glycosylase
LPSGEVVPVLIRPSDPIRSCTLLIKIFSDISTEEETFILNNVQKKFCTNLDLTPFYQKTKSDPPFYYNVSQLYGLKPHLSSDPYEAIIKGIIRQLIRASIARNIISKFIQQFSQKLVHNGKDYYHFPDVEKIAKASKKELLDVNLGYKWSLVKEISLNIVSGDLDLNYLAKMNDYDIIDILTSYNGIGYWTSRIVLYDGFNRVNSYPVRDISHKKALSDIYNREISWGDVESFFEQFSPHTGLTSYYLFGSIWIQK